MFLKVSRSFKKTFSIFALALLIFAIAATALAVDYQPLVPIPVFTSTTGSTLTGYLSGLYNFLISIVVILAMAVIIYGGMRYVVSAGNPAAMEDAKEAIWSAVYGLALALGSWLIINVVNPDILVLKNPGVGLPRGAYSYVASSNSCVASPTGDGTTANPCSCIDGNKNVLASYGNIATAITLTVTPTSVVVPGAINIAGTLKDGAGVSLPAGTPFVLTRANLSFNGSRTPVPLVTGAGGGFNLVAVPITSCNFVESWEVVYNGDATHAPSGSGPVAVTATGAGTNCDAAAYVITPATPFFSLGGCNAICSNPAFASDTKDHCIKADLRLGLAPNPEGKGTINIKVGETVYFDARTYSADYGYPKLKTDVSSNAVASGFANGIDRYMIDFEKAAPWSDRENTMNTVVGYGYGAAETGGCDGILKTLTSIGDILFSSTNGITYHQYKTAGKYKVRLNVYGYAPGCYGPGIGVGYVVVE